MTAPRRRARKPAPVHYRIAPKNLAAHLFEVSVTVSDPDPHGQRFRLPVWIPGSYLIREFARHVVTLQAMQGARVIECRKVDKATWQCVPVKGPVTVTCEIYAWDLSVRGAHLDSTHGFFNGCCVFLEALGKADAPCVVEILPPEGNAGPNWKVATAMRQTQLLARPSGAKRPESRASAGVSPSRTKGTAPMSPGVKSFGTFAARDYAELIDHPVEMGTFAHATFEAHGVPHHIVLTGRHRADLERLCADLKKICEAQITLFEPKTRAAPMGEYWFLFMVVGDGYGGLEHRDSTALIVSREDLPLPGEKRVTAGYRRLLGLASHEYFHAWNVKRITPAAFHPHDLAAENLTRQLWFFEGITSYYDDLTLARCGLIEPLSYLELVAENLGRVMSQSGRLKQSLAEASFDAWIKYYRADENAPNALVSYYQKGGIVGLALDLRIRRATQGAKSLDDVMRALWTRFGKTGKGVPEGEVERLAEEVSGADLTAFFADAVYGTRELDFTAMFADIGIDLNWRTPNGWQPKEPPTAWLGAKVGAEPGGDAKLVHVHDRGPAQQAGLSANDIVIALDGLRVNAATLERRVRSYPVGSSVEVHAFRRDELMVFRVKLETQPAQVCMLTTRDTPVDAKRRRNDWLLGPA